ncbi:thioredoxin [Maricaulis sp.]|uniref:thioredoxin n=1 Tax=Maricaulis sp. TaxID=1486257 RepID=UPI003A8E0709
MTMFNTGTPDADTDMLVKDSTDRDFMADVVEPSKSVPVLVDFWAPWCGPCRQLGPMIEHVVRQAEGAVRLVKINIDENPGIAQQLQVKSIPAVFAFKDGQPVDGFMGALPESQIKDFIQRISGKGPSEAELKAIVDRGMAGLESGDLGGAAQDFASVLQNDQGHPSALAGLARVWLKSGDIDKATQILDQVPADRANDPAVEAARTALELATAAPADDAVTARLRETVKATPTDLQARYDLAEALLAGGDQAGAADQLLAITALDREWNEQAARTLLLKIFEAAGPMSDVARDGRRRLSSILFA